MYYFMSHRRFYIILNILFSQFTAQVTPPVELLLHTSQLTSIPLLCLLIVQGSPLKPQTLPRVIFIEPTRVAALGCVQLMDFEHLLFLSHILSF
jgi:hypothetical protein